MVARTAPALLIAPLLAVLAVGCSGDTVVQPGDQSAGIAVQGVGEVVATPDTGYFSVGIEVTADTVEQARNDAAEAADNLVAAVKDAGVDDKDVRTANFAIFPRYDYSRDRQELVGYTVTNTLEVTVRDLDSFSAVIDGAVEAAGDAARVSGIRFGVEDDKELLKQARELAMEDARRRAEDLAEFGKVRLGDPVSISETQSPSRPPVSPGADDAGRTPIEPGTTTVTVTVSVTYAIR